MNVAPRFQPTYFLDDSSGYWTPPPPHDSLTSPLPPLLDDDEPVRKPAHFYDETVGLIDGIGKLPRPALLLAGLVSLFIKKEKLKPPKRSSLVFDYAEYFTNQKKWVPTFKADRCYVPRAMEIALGTTSRDWLLATGREEKDYQRVPLPNLPASFRESQPPPLPLPNADLCGDSLSFSELQEYVRRVPSIPKRPAKKGKATEDTAFQNRRLVACVLRQIEYLIGEDLLRESGFKGSRHDKRDHCQMCGATFFKSGKCFDCGLPLKESNWFPNSSGLNKYLESQGLGDGTGFSIDGWLDGVRETEQGVPNKEKWLEPRRTRWNPTGKKWADVTPADLEEIKDDPEFATNESEYGMTFCGVRITESAEPQNLKPNTLSKRISRLELKRMFHDVEFPSGQYFCVVSLHKENRLVLLGSADTPLSDVLANFLEEWRKSEKNAIKQARNAAKKSGADQQTREQMERDATEGVRAAYEVVVGLFADDGDASCTYFSFHGHKELIEAASIGWKA
jgi:hypothetical protein